MKAIRNGKEYHILIWVSSVTKNIRARIKGPTPADSYEVTIGGEMWKLGKGQEFKGEINCLCQSLMGKLNKDLFDAFNLKVCKSCKKTVDMVFDTGGCYDCTPF